MGQSTSHRRPNAGGSQDDRGRYVTSPVDHQQEPNDKRSHEKPQLPKRRRAASEYDDARAATIPPAELDTYDVLDTLDPPEYLELQ